jgi:hypothetical protein
MAAPVPAAASAAVNANDRTSKKAGPFVYQLTAPAPDTDVLTQWVEWLWKWMSPNATVTVCDTWNSKASTIADSSNSVVQCVQKLMGQDRSVNVSVISSDGHEAAFPLWRELLEVASDSAALYALPVATSQAECLQHMFVDHAVETTQLRAGQVTFDTFPSQIMAGFPRLVEWTCDGRGCNQPITHIAHSGRGLVGNYLFFAPEDRPAFMSQRRAFAASIRKHFALAVVLRAAPVSSSIGVKRKHADVKVAGVEESTHWPLPPAGLMQRIAKVCLAHSFRFLSIGDMSAAARSCRAWCDAVYNVPLPKTIQEGVRLDMPSGAAKVLARSLLATRHVSILKDSRTRWKFAQLNELHAFSALGFVQVTLTMPTGSVLRQPAVHWPARLRHLNLTFTGKDNVGAIQTFLDRLPTSAPRLEELHIHVTHIHHCAADSKLQLDFLGRLPLLQHLQICIDTFSFVGAADVNWQSLAHLPASLQHLSIYSHKSETRDLILSIAVVPDHPLCRLKSFDLSYMSTPISVREKYQQDLRAALPHTNVTFRGYSH